MAELSREQFADRLIAHVRERFPLVKLARGEEQFSLRMNGQLAPLENLYRVAVLKPDEMNHHIDRWVVELLRASEGTPDQAAPFEQVRQRIYPMVLASGARELQPDMIVSQPLVDKLIVAYALDGDRTIAYIPRAHYEHWGIGLDELHSVAIANLIGRSESIAAQAAQDEQGQINLILFQTMDGYDASRVLLPSLHEKLREHLGSPFVAAIPNRDILICFRDDEQTVARLREQIRDDYQNMPHQVTDRLLLVTPDGIALRAPGDAR
jgi:hypothetical protein